jgi:hypothetical protein
MSYESRRTRKLDGNVTGVTAGKRFRDRVPLREWPCPEDIASAVFSLESENAGFLTRATPFVESGLRSDRGEEA